MAENQKVGDERNLLHPLTTLHWEHCHKWIKRVEPTHCAVVHNTLVILDSHKLYISFGNLRSWTTITAPYEYASLTTYQSKFVLVGGRHPITLATTVYVQEPTNLLWTSYSGVLWDFGTSLPAMPTKRCGTSSISGGSPEVLVVAGGYYAIYADWLDVVEVLLGDHWTTVDSLPTPCHNMRSAVHDGNFYFTRGPYQENTVYSCSCDSLIASARKETTLVWNEMTTPNNTVAIASYSSCLIAIDGDSTIIAYSNTTQTWKKLTCVGAASGEISYTIAAGFSTDELVMANENGIYRGTLSGVNKFEDAYKHFIDSKDVLEFLSLKFMFLGPPRLGKSTTRRRVMKEIVDLNSAKESNVVHGSTGTVECSPNMLVQDKFDSASAKDRSDWTIVQNLADEACVIFHSLKANLETESIPEAAAASLVGSEAKAEVSQASSKVQSRPIEQPPQPKLLQKMMTKIKSLIKTRQSNSANMFTALPTHARPALDGVVAPDYSEIAAIFEEVSQQPKFANNVKHCVKAFLRMEDTGGQPELMDMLPALTIGPGLYLLFFSYEFKLDEEYQVFYQRDSGETTAPEKSEFTLQEMLLCMLASISCSIASNDSLPPQKTGNSDIGEILQSSKSVVYIVGTHKDKVSEDQITLVDEELKRIIENTYFYKKGILQFCSEDKLVVSLDNMGGGIEEIHQLHKLLENAMEKYFKKLRIPAVWLLFSLCLRMRDVRTASMETCLALSGAFNMTPYETEIALWFLHHHAGILMYFPAVASLKDLVIIDIQVVYDSITYAILGAMSFNNSGQVKAERFKQTGRFTINDLNSTTDNITRDLIAPDQLVALLEYLHIIAQILFDDSRIDEDFKEREYIMPCVLEYTSSQELDLFHRESCKSCFVVPLFVYFTCGFTPMGLFPAAMACLISNKSFAFVKEGIKKNMVHFLYGSKEIRVTFICRSTYYEVVVSCDPTFQATVHLECAALKKEIENTLKKASFRMNYSSYMDYKFAFECYSHEKEHHLGIVYGEEDIPSVMRCVKDPQGLALQNRHLIWFGQEYKRETVPEVCESGNCLSGFLKMYPKLVITVEPCVMTVADHCFSVGLISKDVYDRLVQRVDWINIDKTRVLLSSIRTVISSTPTALNEFITVLLQIEDCNEMAERIQRQF